MTELPADTPSRGFRRGLGSVWTSTLLAYAASQVVVLLGAVVRIPLIAGALGETGYGEFVVVTSILPAVQLMATGLSQSARVLVAESPRSAGAVARGLTRTGVVEALVMLALTAVVTPVLWSLSTPTLALSVAAVTIGSALALPVAGYTGILEGYGRTAASHLSLTANTLVGLPVLLLVLQVSHTLLAVVLATALGFLAPYLTCRVLVRRSRGFAAGSSADQVPHPAGTALTRAMTGWALANVLVYIFDPVIIAAVVGSAAAGQYGLANRVTGLVTAAPVALGGLLTVWFARLRTEGDRAELFGRLRQASVLMSVLGVTLALVSTFLGPWIGELLGRGHVGTPRPLYAWLGVYGALVCGSAPIIAAYAAPRAAAFRARVGVTAGLVNAGLSWLLAHPLGTLGPVVATVACNACIILALTVQALRRPDVLHAEAPVGGAA